MNETEKYNVLLQELAESIRSKNNEIAILRWKVADLEAKLKQAEEHAHAE